VIEDAPAGSKGAKSAGATVMGVSTTHGPSDLVEADHLARGLHDVEVEVDARRGDLVVRWSDPRRVG
jgi:beta-phosphoglucomutase-like phosphatase (HAD superfamily)